MISGVDSTELMNNWTDHTTLQIVRNKVAMFSANKQEVIEGLNLFESLQNFKSALIWTKSGPKYKPRHRQLILEDLVWR